jgi:hypothetical protein
MRRRKMADLAQTIFLELRLREGSCSDLSLMFEAAGDRLRITAMGSGDSYDIEMDSAGCICDECAASIAKEAIMRLAGAIGEDIGADK